MLTRQDYVMIAKAITNLRSTLDNKTVDKVARSIANYLLFENYSMNLAKFLTACEVTEQ